MAILKSTRDSASVNEPGLVTLATLQEALDGLRSDKAMTPAGTKAVIEQLIGNAPELLDTLAELAAAINDDENFAVTVQSTLTSLQNQINTLSGTNLGALTQEIDDIETGAGLNSDGSYSAPTSSNYLGSATSLKDADSKLDAAIAANAAAISTMGTSQTITNLQSELDDTQASVGLQTDGTLGTWANNNYYSASASIKGAVEGVDAQVATNTAAIAGLGSSSAITALQSELDDTQTGVGLASDGSHVSRSGSNYIDSATSIVSEITLLDGQIKTNADAIALKASSSTVSVLNGRVTVNESDISQLQTDVAAKASSADLSSLQSEVDATQAGVGLASDGSYSAISGANYATSSSSLKTAVGQLDTQLKSTQDDLDTLEATVSGLGGNNQAEVDAIEASIGINTDGSFTASSSSNYLGSATSVRGEINALDSQVKNNADNIASNDTDIANLQSDLSGKASSSSVTSLQSEVDTSQASAGLNADGSFTANSGGNYISGATTIRGEINALDTQVATNAGDISNLSSTVSSLTSGSSSNASDIAALQSELDTTQAGAGLGTTGAYAANSGSNYLTGATSLKDADNKLDAQIKTNADAIALKASSSALSSLQTQANTNTSDISALESDMAAAQSDILANASAISSNDSDISGLQSELDATQSGAGLSSSGAYTAPSSNYLSSASSLADADSKLDAQIKTNADAIALKASASDVSALTTRVGDNESDIATLQSDVSSLATTNSLSALQTEVDAIETGVGLNTDGSYTALTGNYNTASTLKGAVSGIDTQVKLNADAIASNDTDIASNVAAINTIEASVGLAADGSYSAISGASYATSSSSLKAAVQQLDTQLASTQSDLDTEEAARASADSTLTSAINTVEASVGLSAAGAYVVRSGTNYLDSLSSVVAEAGALDTQVKANYDAIVSNDSDISSLQSDVSTNASDIASLETLADTHESAIGLNTDGTYTAIANANYGTSSNLKGAVQQIDAQVKSNADAIALKASSSSLASLQSEVDATQVGAGLNTDGSYSAISGANYATSGTSLKSALTQLDTQVGTNASAISSETSARQSADTTLTNAVDTIEASVGLQTDGSLSITGTNYLNGSSSIVYALDVLDTNQKLLVDVQANIKTGAGLSSTGTLTAFSSNNYISSASSLKAAIEALDTQVSSNASSISSLGSSNIAALQTEIDDTQAGVGLDSNGDYVSRSGSNYLDSATSIVGEISALDTQVKSNADDISTKANSTTVSALDLRVTQLEIGDGGILLDHASDDAVEMDDTISQFQSKSGPFQISLAGLIANGTTDLVFFGSKGERDGDRHFAIHPTSGDAIFAGKHS